MSVSAVGRKSNAIITSEQNTAIADDFLNITQLCIFSKQIKQSFDSYKGTKAPHLISLGQFSSSPTIFFLHKLFI